MSLTGVATMDRSEMLEAALRPPSRYFVEAGLSTDNHAVGGGNALTLLLSSRTAFDLPIGSIVADSLALRLTLSPSACDDIATALHEGISNAVIHGNLAVASEERITLDGCVAYEESMLRALTDPRLSSKRVAIRLRWTGTMIFARISDDGEGFDPELISVPGRGRGLSMIRCMTQHLAWVRGGRTLLIRFQRED